MATSRRWLSHAQRREGDCRSRGEIQLFLHRRGGQAASDRAGGAIKMMTMLLVDGCVGMRQSTSIAVGAVEDEVR